LNNSLHDISSNLTKSQYLRILAFLHSPDLCSPENIRNITEDLSNVVVPYDRKATTTMDEAKKFFFSGKESFSKGLTAPEILVDIERYFNDGSQNYRKTTPLYTRVHNGVLAGKIDQEAVKELAMRRGITEREATDFVKGLIRKVAERKKEIAIGVTAILLARTLLANKATAQPENPSKHNEQATDWQRRRWENANFPSSGQ